jgi:predicted ATP-binding protein involved in virulence
MTDEELKKKCTERAKIFQQAMKSCKSSSPIDCIEWFADRIAELEKENAELQSELHRVSLNEQLAINNGKNFLGQIADLANENTELKATNERLLESCEGAAMMYKHLTKAKEIIKKLIEAIHIWDCKNLEQVEAEAEQFISEVEK